MSAEGKKKRGISGLANAKTIPFRYGGRSCDYSIAPRPCTSRCGAGSRLVLACTIGVMLPGFQMSEPLHQRVNAAMERCASPYLR